MINKLLLILILPGILFAQVTVGGGKGLMRVYEADAIEYGKLYTNFLFQSYATKVPNKSSLSELYTLNIGLTLGMAYSTEAFLHLIPYHDDQRHIFGPPGDTRIGLKHTIANPVPFWAVASVAYAELPTAVTHPIPFEPYSEAGLGWACLAVASFNFKESSVDLPVKLSINFGYKDHNVNNDVFAGVTDQLIGGMAVKLAFKRILLYSEISGEYFYNNEKLPKSYNSVRFTQGLKFYGPYQVLIDVAGDIDLSQSERPFPASKNKTHRFYEDYADWRFMVGLTYPFKLFYSKETIEQKRRELEERNINEIQKQRQDINKELEEYKKKLEREKKKDLPF